MNHTPSPDPDCPRCYGTGEVNESVDTYGQRGYHEWTPCPVCCRPKENRQLEEYSERNYPLASALTIGGFIVGAFGWIFFFGDSSVSGLVRIVGGMGGALIGGLLGYALDSAFGDAFGHTLLSLLAILWTVFVIGWIVSLFL